MDSPPAELQTQPASALRPLCLLVVLALIAYGPALFTGFILDWDDGLMVARNPMLRPESGVSLVQAWQEPVAGLYAPLTYTLYALVAAVGRAMGRPMDPMLFHAASIGLHLIGGWLLFLWLRRFTGYVNAAVLGTAFWLLHPLQAEPVAWVAGTNSVLGGVLAIAAMLCAIRAHDDAGAGRRNWLILGAIAFAASLAAKPSNIGLPIVLIFLHRTLLFQSWKELLTWAGGWAALAIPFVYQGLSAQTAGLLEGDLPWPQRAMIVGHALGFYFTKIVWPFGLAPEYGLSPTVVLNERRWVGPAIVAVIVLATAISQRRGRRIIFAGVGLTVAALLPILGIIPFYYQSFSIVADRYAYFALIGPTLILAWTVRRASPQKVRMGTVALAVALTGLTLRQVLYWQDIERLWRRAGEINPNGLFYNYHFIDNARDTGDVPGEIAGLERILARRPFDNIQRLRLAKARIKAGQIDQGLVLLGMIADREPRNPDVRVLIAQTYEAQGDVVRARKMFDAALAISPAHPDAFTGLARLNAGPATAPVATQPAGR
jgi:hypothetical protein